MRFISTSKHGLYAALSAVAAVLMLFALACAGGAGTQSGDYDADDDGLIEINNLEQLNAVRWDLDGDGIAEAADSVDKAVAYATAFPEALNGMGCPPDGCAGYELARDLDFDRASSYASGEVSAAWTTGNGWLPIAASDELGEFEFVSTFDGNGHTIANLFIDHSNRDPDASPIFTGLFHSNRGEIRQVGVVDADISGINGVGALVAVNIGIVEDSYVTGNVSGQAAVGGLAGDNAGNISGSYATTNISGYGIVGGLVGENNGDISASYATGIVTGIEFGKFVGGLVGWNYGNISISYSAGSVEGVSEVGGLVGQNNGTISISYATGDVSGEEYIGGLVGYNDQTRGNITSSYATGNVLGGRRSWAGGLVGYNLGAIANSYAIGTVSGESWRYYHGLVGDNSASVTTSYWNVVTAGQPEGASMWLMKGRRAPTSKGMTTTQLQTPTEYSGIYATWHTDIDNADTDYDDDTGKDDFWDFGSSSQYPLLKADIDGDGVATWQEFGNQERN